MRKVKICIINMTSKNPDEAFDRTLTTLRDNHNVTVYDEARPAAEQLKDVEMVVDIGGWETCEMVDAAKNAKLWHVLCTGLDHTRVEYIKSKGIKLANCPGQFSSTGLAECAMMFILMLTRNYNISRKNLDDGIIYHPQGQSLCGMRLALIGFGASGIDLAKRAKSFDMNIEIIEPMDIPKEVINEIKPDFIGKPENIDEVIKRCDVLSLHVPLNDNTHHLIDAKRISMMTPDAYLINVSRGAIVDEDAMCEALLNGKLGGAGLDVFSKEPPDLKSPAYQLPNVVMTSHIAGSTNEVWRKRAAAALENANRLANNEQIKYQVE